MKKRLSAILLVVVAMTALFGITAYAVEARYVYTTSAISTLSISSGNAYCKSTARGNDSATKIEAIQYLEKKNGTDWKVVSSGTWRDSVSGSTLTMNNWKNSLSSGTYRVRAVFTVYSGTKSEVAEAISLEVTI